MKVGIFWHYQNQVIGIAHDFNLSQQDSIGLIDSAYVHVKYWKALQNQIAALRHIEYEEIPRGRVIYNSLSNKTIVYMDAKLFKKNIAQQIATFFELHFDDIIWKKDPHYKT